MHRCCETKAYLLHCKSIAFTLQKDSFHITKAILSPFDVYFSAKNIVQMPDVRRWKPALEKPAFMMISIICSP